MDDTTTTTAEKVAWLEQWATSKGCTLKTEGEVGFGRECVGIASGNEGSYIDLVYYDADYREAPWSIPTTESVPENIPDRYHKHECLAVLGRGDDAIDQLYRWVRHIDAAGFTVEWHPRLTLDVSAMLGERTVAVLARA